MIPQHSLHALRAARRSLAFATAIDHPLFQTEALTALAQTYTTLGDSAAAEQARLQATTLLRELGLAG
jgi:molybdopterin-guanine dinucleotide biosynthesis protein A